MKDKAYQIATAEHRCCSCEVEIDPGGDFYSTVCFLGEEFARRTYCTSCWTPGDESAGDGAAGDRPAGDRPADDSTSTGTGSQGQPAGAARPANIFAYWRTRRPEDAGAEAVKIRFDPQVVLEFFRGWVMRPAGRNPDRRRPAPGRPTSSRAPANLSAGTCASFSLCC